MMPTHSTISPIEATAKSLDALLTSIENPPSPAAIVAFKAALTRHGRNLHAVCGPEALAAVVKRIRDEASEKAQADERERVITEAWAGIIQAKDAAA